MNAIKVSKAISVVKEFLEIKEEIMTTKNFNQIQFGEKVLGIGQLYAANRGSKERSLLDSLEEIQAEKGPDATISSMKLVWYVQFVNVYRLGQEIPRLTNAKKNV